MEGGGKCKKIGDLQVGDKAVSVFGVATLFRPPSKSRGKDYSCTIEIVDETCPSNPLTCVCFHPDLAQLPQQCAVGDIVYLHKMKVIEYNGRKQGNCWGYSTAVTFSGDPDAEVVRKTGSSATPLMEADRERVVNLKQWAKANYLTPMEGE